MLARIPVPDDAAVDDAPLSLREAAEAGHLIATRPDSQLHRWLTHGRAHAAIVRPDDAVLHAGHQLSVLCTALPVFGTNLPLTTTGRYGSPATEAMMPRAANIPIYRTRPGSTVGRAEQDAGAVGGGQQGEPGARSRGR